MSDLEAVQNVALAFGWVKGYERHEGAHLEEVHPAMRSWRGAAVSDLHARADKIHNDIASMHVREAADYLERGNGHDAAMRLGRAIDALNEHGGPLDRHHIAALEQHRDAATHSYDPDYTRDLESQAHVGDYAHPRDNALDPVQYVKHLAGGKGGGMSKEERGLQNHVRPTEDYPGGRDWPAGGVRDIPGQSEPHFGGDGWDEGEAAEPYERDYRYGSRRALGYSAPTDLDKVVALAIGVPWEHQAGHIPGHVASGPSRVLGPRHGNVIEHHPSADPHVMPHIPDSEVEHHIAAAHGQGIGWESSTRKVGLGPRSAAEIAAIHARMHAGPVSDRVAGHSHGDVSSISRAPESSGAAAMHMQNTAMALRVAGHAGAY